MALSAAFLEELRARTPLPALVARRVKLARAGRSWKGCCPFHGEKTPSFHVYDDHYHCFGCGAHGDAISFVMQSQGAAFIEAVEQLSAEAGLDVPKPSPEEAEAEQRRHDLVAVLEAAAGAFQRRLFLPEGRAALAYLRNRGLTDDTIRRFALGWSGEGRGALTAELAQLGMMPDQLAAAGLLREAEPGQPRPELYFNRVIFPIRDRRGRIISFGGRLLGDGEPKYVNGPETALFSKRRSLYGLDFARAALRDGGQKLLVVEGYMDVIALHQAGLSASVAPLGTALTEEQLAELWRLAPEPILCFDGDAAGARAAARAAELALPLLAPDRTLRLASLPAGEDPDSLLRHHGAAEFRGVLAAARPLSDALYELLQPSPPPATPEQRAAFRTRLEEAARRIPDRALSSEYRRALLDRFFAGRRLAGRPPPAAALARPVPTDAQTASERGRILIAILLLHPAVLADVEDALRGLDLADPLDALRQAILNRAAAAEPAETLDSAALMNHVTQIGMAEEMAQVLSTVPVPLPVSASPDVMPAEAEAGWWHIFGLMNRGRLEQEVAEASRDFATRADDATQRRLIALCAAFEALRRGEQGEQDV